MKNKIKVGITGVNHLNGNRGVGALAVSSVYILNKIAAEQNVSIDITTINTNYGKSIIDVSETEIRIKSILPTSFFGLKNILKFFTSPKNVVSFSQYLKLDVILCMGEGDSFSDIYGLRRFEYINDQHRMARLFRKKYLLLPQTIGPYKDHKVQKHAKKSIEKASFVFSRDKQSYTYLKENTKQTNAIESVDVAFFMPFEKQTFSNDYIHVGLNVSSLLWHGGYTKNNQFGLESNYKELVTNVINYFLSIPNVKLHLVPHVVHEYHNIENDYAISLELMKQYNHQNLILSPFFLTPIDAKNYISGLDFFAGARMHACIAAFSSGVPVFPLAYSRKFNGLFKDTLDYPYMGDMVIQEEEEVLKDVKLAFDKRSELKEIIEQRIKNIISERALIIKNQLTKFLELKS